MDQLAPFFGWIKKNIFWLGCGFLAIAMIAIFFVTTSTLAKETDENKRKVESSIQTADRILKISAEDDINTHPNSSSEDGMKTELVKTAKGIVDAWRIREEAQKNLLVWPSELESDALIAFFAKYNPPERYPEILQKESQIQPGLELYGAKIPDRMDYLCGDSVLRAHWIHARMNGPATDNKMANGNEALEDVRTADEKRYAVVWSDINQDLWHDKLTKFQGLDDNISSSLSPTALQCYMLQQDLWLLEAMFKIIRQVNGNSNATDLSSIKRIDHIAIGREAVGALGGLKKPDSTLGKEALKKEEPKDNLTEKERRAELNAGGGFKSKKGGGGGGEAKSGDNEDGRDESEAGGGMGGGPSKGGFGSGDKRSLKRGSDEIDSTNLPFEGRYVDRNSEPLSALQVQDIIMGTGDLENNLELIVAKRVPVRIALRMDENKIAEFMAACANSPFAFEIQQVRLNKHKAGGEKIDQSGRGKGNNSTSDKLAGMGQSMGGGEESSASLLVAQDIETRTNYDVNVEFYGIVKIYNPVREDFLYKAFELENGKKPGPNDSASTSNATKKGNLNP